MAEVYEAHDLRHDRSVAIKFLDERQHSASDVERFLREVRVAARLSHPHILPVFDSGEACGRLYYVMPLVEGESLRDRIRQDGHLSLTETIRIAREIAEALDYAHREGIIHRDVKPENILFSHGHALLADFGIARLLARGETLTAVGVAVGTPTYMSPEQLLGDDVGPPTDVFALGCVVYEMLDGSPPFPRAASPAEFARRIVASAPSMRSSRSDVSRAMESVVLRALSAQPSERYRSAGELARALESASSSGELPAPAPLSLIVRPFDSVGGSDDTRFLCDGLTEEVIADLANVGALRVISRTTSMHYRETRQDARSIGAELGVRYVVSGSVQRAGTRVRVRGELVDTLLDTAVWSGKFDGSADDPFDLQERVAQAIVEALRVALTPDEQRKLTARPIPDARAYEAYRLASAEILRFSREGLDQARELIDEALARVGDNALLVATRGQIEWQYVNAGFDPDETRVREAERWLRRALELDRDQPQALSGLGWILGSRGQMGEAIRLLVQSLDADPNESTTITLLALFSWITGRWDLMRAMCERAALIDPLHLWGLCVRALLAAHDRNFTEVERLFEIAIRLEPGAAFIRTIWGICHLQSGDRDRARAVMQEGRDWVEADPLERLALAMRAMLSGEPDVTRRLLAPESMGPMMDDAQWGWHMADILAEGGLLTDAIDVLSRAVAQGMSNVDMLEHEDQCLRMLRSDPRFSVMLNRARLAASNIPSNPLAHRFSRESLKRMT
jgi:eukaryotic-like serine/threonine-protein kinase